jgi:hypothetical protein
MMVLLFVLQLDILRKPDYPDPHNPNIQPSLPVASDRILTNFNKNNWMDLNIRVIPAINPIVG